MNQSDPAEGKEANLLLNSESNWLFLPHRKDHSRALNRYTFPFSRIKLVRSPKLNHLDCIGGVKALLVLDCVCGQCFHVIKSGTR